MNTDTSPAKWPFSFQYFFYFGVMGVTLPYFTVYGEQLNFTGNQIGIMGGVRTLTVVVFAIVWGFIADRFNIRKPVYVICNILSAAICSLLLFTEQFWPMLLITFFYSVFYGPLIAFLEAFTMAALDNNKKIYGKIRVWGSVSFILMVTGIGVAMDYAPVKIVIYAVVILSVLQAIFAPAVSAGKDREQIKLTSKEIKELFSPRIIIFLLCGFLMLLSHGTYYGFFSIHLGQLHYSKTFVGCAWGLASIIEVVVMIKSDIIFKRFSIQSVLVFAIFMAAIRWLILSFYATPVMILFSQIFHAVTYGAFHIASILYIEEHSSPETKMIGQVALFVFSYGLGIGMGFFFNGRFVDTLGCPKLYLISCMIAISAGIILYFSERRATLTALSHSI